MKVSDIIGYNTEDNFMDFDLTEVQTALAELKETDAVDIPHAESLSRQALHCADLLCEYTGRLTKTVAYLEARLSTVRNQTALNYESPTGKTTAEMRKWAMDLAPQVEELSVKIGQAKGAKASIDKKLDILIKMHHHYKDIAAGLRKTVLGYGSGV